MRVLIVGGGVAGSEVGTFLGSIAKSPLEIVEIEYEPRRRFGGWGFQSFPGETTNLAMRKMYLGEGGVEDILEWSTSACRDSWPEPLRNVDLPPDHPFPRVLMREYVKWRRGRVNNPHVTYESVVGEAIKVQPASNVRLVLNDGRIIEGDRLVMASGSISVKVPPYLNAVRDDEKVIIDPLVLEGHERRATIPQHAKVLILGTGLTGEEQINVLLKSNHTHLTLLSRGGQRHFPYPKEQTNLPLVLDQPPEFLMAETPEEFNQQMSEFFGLYLSRGHSPEDVYAAIRPLWDKIRKDMGGCVKAAERLHKFKRSLAVNSIGTTWEVSGNLQKALDEGVMTLLHGYIQSVKKVGNQFEVVCGEDTMMFDYIINAVGRNIIRHSIWETMLNEGIAKKHAGIGVRVSRYGRMINAQDQESNQIWVIGMARAGDHALRHGFLGNTAFNVPQVRAHLYTTIRDLAETL